MRRRNAIGEGMVGGRERAQWRHRAEGRWGVRLGFLSFFFSVCFLVSPQALVLSEDQAAGFSLAGSPGNGPVGFVPLPISVLLLPSLPDPPCEGLGGLRGWCQAGGVSKNPVGSA